MDLWVVMSCAAVCVQGRTSSSAYSALLFLSSCGSRAMAAMGNSQKWVSENESNPVKFAPLFALSKVSPVVVPLALSFRPPAGRLMSRPCDQTALDLRTAPFNMP